MVKNRTQIYVRVNRDSCVYAMGSCKQPRVVHPVVLVSGPHDFVAGDAKFVYPTDAERRKIYEQLKEEFDA